MFWLDFKENTYFDGFNKWGFVGKKTCNIRCSDTIEKNSAFKHPVEFQSSY